MGWFSKKGDVLKSVRSGDLEALEAALASGASPDAQDWSRKTALMYAAVGGHTEIVRTLLQAGADPHRFDSSGESALVHAAVNGHLAVVRELIAGGTDPNVRNAAGKTALIAMAHHVGFTPQPVHEQIVREMIAAGLNVNGRGDEESLPLIVAIDMGSLELARAMLEGGADPNGVDGYAAAIVVAAAAGHGPIVAALLEAGADHGFRSRDDLTPLMMAAGGFKDDRAADDELAGWASASMESRVHAVRALIAGGAEVNASNSFGGTALMAAVQMDRDEVIRVLAAAGADLDATHDASTVHVYKGVFFSSSHVIDERSGITPLMDAAAEGRTMAAIALIELGADLDLRDSEGLTALEIARNAHPDTAAAMSKAIPMGNPLGPHPVV